MYEEVDMVNKRNNFRTQQGLFTTAKFLKDEDSL